MKLAVFFLALVALPALADAPSKAPRFEITVTRQGFEPEQIKVPAKTPVKLVFTRKTDRTCAKQVIIKLDATKKIERELPLDTAVEIDVTFPKAGTLGYACSMDMTKGTIVVN